MPALLMVRAIDNPVPDSPGKYYAGQMLRPQPANRTFGFKEMPLQNYGAMSMATLRDMPVMPPYSLVTMDSDGVMGDAEVKQGDKLVLQRTGEWMNFGSQERTPGNFFHVVVTDKTPEDMEDYAAEVTREVIDPETGLLEEELIRRSRYRFTEEGLGIIKSYNGLWEATWAEVEPYLTDEAP